MVSLFESAHDALTQRRAVIESGVATEAEHLELAAIDAALERIANGVYGQCVRCDGAVGRQRLKAVPEAAFCAGCADQSSATSSESEGSAPAPYSFKRY